MPRASGASRSVSPLWSSFEVPVGTARENLRPSIDKIMGIPPPNSGTIDGTVGGAVKVAKDQYLANSARSIGPLPDYGRPTMVQIYITNFSGPYRRLSERGLISQRGQPIPIPVFRDIIDPASGRHLFTVEARGAQRHTHRCNSAADDPNRKSGRRPNRTYATGPRPMGCGAMGARTSTTDHRDGHRGSARASCVPSAIRHQACRAVALLAAAGNLLSHRHY